MPYYFLFITGRVERAAVLRLSYFAVFKDHPLILISYSEIILAIVYSFRLLSAPIVFTGVRNPNVVLHGLSSKYCHSTF